VTNLYASDFPWCLEPLLLRNVTAHGRRHNLLVNCSPADFQHVAADLTALCAAPVVRCSMPGWLDLPLDFAGTLLLTRIEEMTIDQQIALFDWMTVSPRTQVVSLATTRIDQLVKDGRFLEGLFYRLNVVQLDARSPLLPGYQPAADRPKLDCRTFAHR
jgi:transcriptional regulator of acetoin/glycerol metabolism